MAVSSISTSSYTQLNKIQPATARFVVSVRTMATVMTVL